MRKCTGNKIAKAVGAFFIITMILGMIDAYTVAPILQASLADYYSNGSQLEGGRKDTGLNVNHCSTV